MKRKLKTFIAFATTITLIIFLIHSFYAVSFDISKWSESTRFMCCLLMCVGLLLSGMLSDVIED